MEVQPAFLRRATHTCIMAGGIPSPACKDPAAENVGFSNGGPDIGSNVM